MSEIPLPPNAAPRSAAVAPTIADVSYRNYDGPLRAHAARWWVVTKATIRQNVNRRRFGYWIPAILIGIVYLFQGVIFYVTTNIRQQIESQGGFLPGAPANPYALTLYTTLTWTYLFLFAAALTVGSASIAADNRANALLVYLSKPVTRADYLLGKWAGIFFLLAALSTVPAILMYLFFLVSYYSEGFLTQNPGLWWRLILASMVGPAVHASLITGFSAWSKTPRVAAATYAAFYFICGSLSSVVAQMLLERDRSSNGTNTAASVASSMHVDGVSSGVTMHLLDVSQRQLVERLLTGGGARRQPRRAELPPTKDPVEIGRRKEREEREARRAERRRERMREALDRVPERPPLVAVLLIGGLFVGLPVAAAVARVRAVEVIKG